MRTSTADCRKSPLAYFINGTVKIQRFLLILTSSFLAVSVSAMAILRYLFKTNLFGIEEFILICGMWLYFVGASHGTYEKSQICASIIDMFIKNPKTLRRIDLFQQAVSLLLLVIFSVYSVQFLQFSIAAGAKSQIYKIPYAIGHVCVTINVILMTFYTAVHLVTDIYSTVGCETSGVDSLTK